MDTRRLRYLVELANRGSMRLVAEALHVTTSTVSQQLALLAKEAGAALVEPDGRRVRLTPAGHRLAGHAVTILSAVEAARLDLAPGATPAGTVRVAGFATAVRRSLLPIVGELARHHPDVRLLIHEHEPAEAFALLASDEVDLALTYGYNLAPATFDPAVHAVPLWTTAWGLGVPTAAPAGGSAVAVFAAFRDHDWIVNSRNTADERVVRTIAALAGFEPRIAHRADSLELVQDLITAGLGVGLLPEHWPLLPGESLVPLTDPAVTMRAYAVTRRGRSGWPPLALVLRMLRS
ncbi:LysR family transcriptional regulator [Dactylosporangium fulvum]|uniref:LysR family transcriptional regulator n=1 Tax=Dactylosporangium fulvum TaxID=53359 RepID=UPI0031D0E5A4